jgi:hypothetical protein
MKPWPTPPGGWIPLLQAAGHEAVHWSEVGDPRAPDTALMQWAIANSYAVDLVRQQGWQPCAPQWLPPPSPAER